MGEWGTVLLREFPRTALLVLVLSGCNSTSELLTVASSKNAPKTTSINLEVIEPAPNSVPAGSEGKFSGVASGFQHMCAVVQETLKCWGLNRHGQIGNGESGSASDSPDPYAGTASTPRTVLRPYTVLNESVTGVAVGYEHSCAIHRGALKCFGSNEYHQLGVEQNPEKLQSAPVEVLVRVREVAARGRWTCAITQSQELYCWGVRLVHDGETLKPKLISKLPLKIPLEGVTRISMSATHACAIASGALHCWGLNSAGEIGNGDASGADVESPYRVFSAGVSDVKVTDGRSCAIVSGKVQCFGASLGDREIDKTPQGVWKTPERSPYVATFWNGIAPLQKITASGAALANSDLHYGSYFHNDGTPRLTAKGVIDVDFSEADLGGCMMFKNLQVYCWGPNLFGQLGIDLRGGEDLPIYKATAVRF